jgi:phage tail tape-measure protein
LQVKGTLNVSEVFSRFEETRIMAELHELSETERKFLINKRQQASSATGAVSGAVGGAAVGSVIPGVGTVVGAVVGGVIGFAKGTADSVRFEDAKTFKQLNKGYLSETVSGLAKLFR